MKQVNLKTEETQTVRITLGGRNYGLRIYPFRGLMYADVTRNKEYVLAGKRIMANQWVLPLYYTAGKGNFRFETYIADRNSYVWYEDFNSKFRLVIYDGEEIAEMRNGE